MAPVPASTQTSLWPGRLADLGRAVRAKVTQARDRGTDLARPVAEEGGDTIFAIDREVEPVIEQMVGQWGQPMTLVAEGLGESGVRVFGEPAKSRYRLIIDPIDGTRNLMYDKRSAWFLAAIAEDKGQSTDVAQAFASAMVELPNSRTLLAQVFAADDTGLGNGFGDDATSGQPIYAVCESLDGSNVQPQPVTPSQASSLHNGFGQVANFFPGTKVLAAQLMERIVEATLGEVTPGSAAVFDDQYITTGGQMVELMLGHDRFCADLRPLFYDILNQSTGHSANHASSQPVRGLECHPYDVAGLLVAQRSGVIITDGFGRALRTPMDVHSPVSWCGYANAALREQIEPVIVGWLHDHGVSSR